MTLTLTMIGAGEYTSLESGETRRYMRFRAANGQEVNLECTEEQLQALFTFASQQVGAQQERPAPAAEKTAVPRPAAIERREGDPNIPDEDEDEGNNVVSLRGISPFAGREDNDL